MVATVNFLAAAGPGSSYSTRAASYTADANGLISGVPLGGFAIQDLIAEGCIPLAFSPSSVYRDLLDGGDFTIAPWQRNVPAFATSNALTTPITNSVVYFADRWFHVAGASGSVVPSKYADTSVASYNTALKVQRSSGNTDVTLIQTGQILENADVIRCQGQYLTFSILAKAGANFSGGTLTMSIIGGTGVNQSSASLTAGTWTGISTLATQAITPSVGYQKFALTTANVVASNITELAVLITFTPSGTAGTDDSFYLLDTQLELGASASPFERRDAQVELEICQRYAAVFAEPAVGVFIASGNLTSSTNASIIISLPVQMWKAPSLTGFGSAILGGFKVAAAGGNLTTSALAGNSNHTSQIIGLSATVSGGTTGQGVTLVGTSVASGGAIVASADF